MKIRKNALAYCSRGRLGLITSDAPVMVSFKGSTEPQEAWVGVHLYDYEIRDGEGKVISVVRSGDPWASRMPKVVAYLDNFVPQVPPSPGSELRCPACLAEMSILEAQRGSCCPQCGHFGSPQRVENDVILRMNWEEVRILAEFTNEWAAGTKVGADLMAAFSRIFCKLRKVRPENAQALLSYENLAESNLQENRRTFADKAPGKSSRGMVN